MARRILLLVCVAATLSLGATVVSADDGPPRLLSAVGRLRPPETIERLVGVGPRSALFTVRGYGLTPEDRAFLEKAVAWLLSKQMKNGTWGYPEGTEQFYDNSNTQYALLALKSAARCGIKISPSVWRRIADHWLETMKTAPGGEVELKLDWVSASDPGVEVKSGEKSAPGTWGYFVRPRTEFGDQVPDQGYGSMVCAGLTSLIIAESELFRTKDLGEDLRRLDPHRGAG